MARLTKLTPATQKKICEFLKQGHFLKTAADVGRRVRTKRA